MSALSCLGTPWYLKLQTQLVAIVRSRSTMQIETKHPSLRIMCCFRFGRMPLVCATHLTNFKEQWMQYYRWWNGNCSGVSRRYYNNFLKCRRTYIASLCSTVAPTQSRRHIEFKRSAPSSRKILIILSMLYSQAKWSWLVEPLMQFGTKIHCTT